MKFISFNMVMHSLFLGTPGDIARLKEVIGGVRCLRVNLGEMESAHDSFSTRRPLSNLGEPEEGTIMDISTLSFTEGLDGQ